MLERGSEALPWMVVLVVALIATVTDVRSRRVPNLLTLPVLLGGLVWSAVAGGWTGLLGSLGACVLLALPYVLLFLFAGGGAGDAKLMAAIGAWLGMLNGVITLGAVAFSGAALAFIYAGRHGRLRPLLIQLKRMFTAAGAAVYRHTRWRETPQFVPIGPDAIKMPYSIAVLAGVCIAMGAVHAWSA